MNHARCEVEAAVQRSLNDRGRNTCRWTKWHDSPRSQDNIHCEYSRWRRRENKMLYDRITLNDRMKEKSFCIRDSLVSNETKDRCHEIPQLSIYTWNGIMQERISLGEYEAALECFCVIRQKGIDPVQTTILNAMKACTLMQSISWARLVHAETLRTSLESAPGCGNALVHMYVKCNSVEDAWKVFRSLTHPDIVSWGTIISGCAIHGYNFRALNLFTEMLGKGVFPNAVVFLGILKASMNLRSLLMIIQSHHQIVSTGLTSDIVLISKLIDMYSKFGCLVEAQHVFDKLQQKNVVSWGAIIAGYVQHGHGIPALALYEKMKQEGLKPDQFILSSVFKACSKVGEATQGKLIHIQVIYCKFKLDIIVGNSLIDMYAKCGYLEMAVRVFDEMSTKDTVSWGAIITGYVQHDHCDVALELYTRMVEDGLNPDCPTLSCLIKACGTMGTLLEGRLLHEQIIRAGHGDDLITGNALLDMYSKCGNLEDAQRLFDILSHLDLVSWDAMIAGYVQHGNSLHALELFSKMRKKGIEPDKITFLSILKACGRIIAIGEGRLVHDEIIRKGLESDVIVGNALVDMYVKFGSLEEARVVFSNLVKPVVVSWGIMISGYAQHGHIASALELLYKMHSERLEIDKITCLCILNACSKMHALKQGRMVHEQIIMNGLHSDLIVNNAVIDMYAKCGSLREAHKVFDSLPDRNVVSWDTMLSGFLHHGYGRSAIQLWKKMCKEGVKPIRVTFLCALKACCITESVREGRLLHYHIMHNGIETSITIRNTLIDMYAKCGCVDDANHVFMRSLNQDAISWGAMISGHARSGNHTWAIQCLGNLQDQGLKPNGEIFLGLLVACRQAGLVDEGHDIFRLMSKEYNVAPCIEHWSCMVDLLGNAGLLMGAINFIQSMPSEPDALVWTSLLNNCELFGNMQIGNYCFDKLIELSQDDASVYALMAKIYGGLNMQEDAERMKMMGKPGFAKKSLGLTWIREMHEDTVESNFQIQNDETYPKMNGFCNVIREGGYISQLDHVTDVEGIQHDSEEATDEEQHPHGNYARFRSQESVSVHPAGTKFKPFGY